MSDYVLKHGDCSDVLATLASNSVDSIVTDPPAGIGFMGKAWDSDKGGRDQWIAWLASVMREAMHVLKPGAHGLVWALPKTSHWTATALEDAGFEIRDVITHHFGTGFPKSLDVSKAIDKAAGAEREVIGVKIDASTGKPMSPKQARGGASDGWDRPWRTDDSALARNISISAPATDAAKQWAGWGTALKPASEHWILVRKPLIGTVATNVQAHGVGGINVDACRIEGVKSVPASPRRVQQGAAYGDLSNDSGKGSGWDPGVGRWPANVVFSHSVECVEGGACVQGCPVRELDERTATMRAGKPSTGSSRGSNAIFGKAGDLDAGLGVGHDTGAPVSGASRFFYCAKPSQSEKNSGGANVHPTVKSIALMRWLIRLVTPQGGLVLDPFAGSGTTGIAAMNEGARFIGIEQDDEFAKIAVARIANASRGQGDLPLAGRAQGATR